MEPEPAETERMRFRGETEPSSLLVLSSISSSESFSSVTSFTPPRMCVPPSKLLRCWLLKIFETLDANLPGLPLYRYSCFLCLRATREALIDFSFFTDAAALRPNLSGEPCSEDMELLASVSMIAENEICLCSKLFAAAAYPSGCPPSGAWLISKP